MKSGNKASIFTGDGSWRLIPVAVLLCSLEFLLIGINILRVPTVIWEYVAGGVLIVVGLLLGTLAVIVFLSDDSEEGTNE